MTDANKRDRDEDKQIGSGKLMESRIVPAARQHDAGNAHQCNKAKAVLSKSMPVGVMCVAMVLFETAEPRS
jgi:hypothetical protein